MLTDKIKKLSAETQSVKREIYDAIVAQSPPDWGKTWFKIIKFSELENSILSPAYYNTGSQLCKLSAYVTEKSERSLETILNTFTSVVNDGKAPAFKDVLFNKTTRAVIAALI
jgi:hypothetical protein